ncbi:MAG TPA: DNA ligase D [Chitinophagaceae bacterium]|nr:DNA ligase D [Chitinophagaceae bacterium]
MRHHKKIKPPLASKTVKGLKRVPSKKSEPLNKASEAIKIDVRAREQYESIIELIKRKLTEEPKCPIPHNLKPMLASIADKPFSNPEWQFEIKWDGYRALAFLENGDVKLKSRNNISFNLKYPQVCEALSKWPVNAVIDGEIVVLNAQGKADFKALQDWQHIQNGELAYYVFDLLWLDGISLFNLPLVERQEILKKLVPESGTIRFSESIDEYGVDFYKIAKENGLEGIIAKQKDAIYQPATRTKSWVKIKVENRHEAVICGFTRNRDTDRIFSSLVLGVMENDHLKFIGQVGTGFTQQFQVELMKKMQPLVTQTCPFAPIPATTAPTTWIRPSLICEVKYTELTPEGVMRHPSFQGLREDKTILDLNNEKVHRKELAHPARRNKRKKAAPLVQNDLVDSTKEQAIVTLNNHELKLSHLKKVFWIKEEINKGDLLNYYHRVADYIMPYMKDRPQSLNRFPNGTHGHSFYQKNMAGKVENWVNTFRRVSESSNEDKDFMICSDEASLIYMVNLGCIELNPWHSRVQTPLSPDWSVIDLDPGNISFEKVIETAMVTKKVLDTLQVPSFPKTSGSTGIHIYIPLGAKYNYEQSKQFAELIAHLVHEELPTITSLIRKPELRKDKIYVDFLQNRAIQTICAPYSVRPKEGATVSAPLHWSEVKPGLKMGNFTIKNMHERVRSEGDLFTGVLDTGIDLNKVLKALSSLV